jgi:hypothetical protein
VHEIAYNPAALFEELAVQLQYQMNTTDALEFYLRGRPLSMSAQVSDVSIGATDYITVLHPGDAHGRAAAPRRSREARGLPPRDERPDLGQDPPDFCERVDALMELGAGTFSVEQCQIALRSAFYNSDRATIYLFGNRVEHVDAASQLTDEDAEIVHQIAEETTTDPRIVAQIYLMADRDRDSAYRTVVDLPAEGA